MKQRWVAATVSIVADYKDQAIEMVVHWSYPLDAVGQGLPAANFARYARKRGKQEWHLVGWPSQFDEMIWPAMNRALEACIASKERRMVQLTDEQVALLQMPTGHARPQ